MSNHIFRVSRLECLDERIIQKLAGKRDWSIFLVSSTKELGEKLAHVRLARFSNSGPFLSRPVLYSSALCFYFTAESIIHFRQTAFALFTKSRNVYEYKMNEENKTICEIYCKFFTSRKNIN